MMLSACIQAATISSHKAFVQWNHPLTRMHWDNLGQSSEITHIKQVAGIFLARMKMSIPFVT